MLGLLLAAACGREPGPPVGVDPAADPPPPAPRVETLHELVPDVPLEVTPTPGEPRLYSLPLAPGQFLEVLIEQLDADVVVRLTGPAGEELLVVDSLSGRRGPERVVWVAEQGGLHRLEVTASRVGRDGSYRATLRALRPAAQADRERAAAAGQLARGDALRRRGSPAETRRAITAYEDALARWERLGDRSRQAEALFALGYVHWQQPRQPRQALSYFGRALPLFEELADVSQQAACLHWLGHIHRFVGEMAQALERYEQALALRRQAGNLQGEASTSNNLGHVFHQLGEVPEALGHYERAIELWRQLGDTHQEARTLHNRGQLYASLGNKEPALEDLRRALELREAAGSRSRQASTLNAIGILIGQSGEPELALDHLRRALRLRQEAGDDRGQGVTLNSLGVVYKDLGQATRARECFEQALEIFLGLGDRRQEAIARHNVGEALSSLGQPREALGQYRQALGLFREMRDRQGEIMTLASLARGERRLGNLEPARAHLERALEAIEDLRAKPASLELRTSYFATKQSYYELFVDLLMELARQQPGAGHDAEALGVSERARARFQLDSLTESGADLRLGADAELRREERQLDRGIAAGEIRRQQLLEERAAAGRIAAVEQELRRLLTSRDRLRARIRLASPRYAELTQPRTLSASEIQRRVLDDDTLLLEYKLGRQRSYLWAVSRRRIASFELPGRAEIEHAAERAYRFLTLSYQRGGQGPAELALARLSDMLLGPVAELLGNRRLLIVSEGALQYIPFAALPIPPGAGGPGGDAAAAPLVTRHEVVSVPSVSILGVLRGQRAQRRRAPELAAVIADPVFDAGDPRVGLAAAAAGSPAERSTRGPAVLPRRFERLTFSRLEAEAILELAPPGSIMSALDFAANRETATSGELGRYRILHFATHGLLNAEHPGLSCLVLSLVDEHGEERNGYLFAQEIYNLELPVELVVLSACQTALGTEIRGEGLVGLTQSFMYAGAERVVVSLWNVDDRATAELMRRFYRNLLGEQRLSPAAALRAAQVSIRQRPRWRAPYFWAGFTIQGEWR